MCSPFNPLLSILIRLFNFNNPNIYQSIYDNNIIDSMIEGEPGLTRKTYEKILYQKKIRRKHAQIWKEVINAVNSIVYSIIHANKENETAAISTVTWSESLIKPKSIPSKYSTKIISILNKRNHSSAQLPI